MQKGSEAYPAGTVAGEHQVAVEAIVGEAHQVEVEAVGKRVQPGVGEWRREEVLRRVQLVVLRRDLEDSVAT